MPAHQLKKDLALTTDIKRVLPLLKGHPYGQHGACAATCDVQTMLLDQNMDQQHGSQPWHWRAPQYHKPAA